MKLLLCLLPFALGGADLDHKPWDALLKRYVNEQHLVDYAAWKQHDVAALDSYLQQIARPWPIGLALPARKAALIDAYDALTIRWVLANYPVKSIWRTENPFNVPRHVVNGHKVSLDDVESELRRMGDPRIHAALVCAARSCPPLRREAYVTSRVEEQLEDNMRAWLQDSRCNEFFPKKNLARISMIFRWYRGDFEQDGRRLADFLTRYGPPGVYTNIQFRLYEWGLNDASGLGSDYSGVLFLLDRARNLL